MAPQEYAELKLTADVLGNGDTTGTFQLERGTPNEVFRIDTGIEMVFPVGEAGGRGLVDKAINVYNSTLGSDQPGRKDVIIDLGAGQHFVEINFGHNPSDSTVTWGDGSGTVPADATGASHPLTQIDTIMWYLLVGTYDSRNAASLTYGEFSSGGALDALDVVPLQPSFSWQAGDDQSALSGSIRCIVTDLDNQTATGRQVKG